MKLTLDFLSPSPLVISLKGGELYFLGLVVDRMRSVPGYLFLGSRLGNSLLFRTTSREVGQARRVEMEPPSKKKRLDTELEMDADFEMLSRQDTAQHKITAFTFEVKTVRPQDVTTFELPVSARTC